MNRKRLGINDVFTGIVAVLAEKEERSLYIGDNRFDQAMHSIYHRIQQQASQQGLKLDFIINPHFIHGDSQTVQDAIYFGMRSGLVTVDSPGRRVMRISISGSETKRFLETLPGNKKMYYELADELLNFYRNVPVDA